MTRNRRKEATEAAAALPTREVSFGPLPEYLGYTLRRAQMASVGEFLEAFKDIDIRPTQLAVLIIIRENPGIRQREVCEALGIQKANFVPLLNELERRGLTLRKPVAGDRRSLALHLTTLGNATLQRACQIHDAYEERFIARLGRRGHDQLLALLNKLMDSG